MFALLGDIRFDLITYFDGFSSSSGVRFSEHAVINGKPRLQFGGDELDEIRIQLSFHKQFCDPNYELLRLKTAKEAHQAMALVLGNGDHKGVFVLTQLQAVNKQTDAKGGVIAVEANIILREFAGLIDQPKLTLAVKNKLFPVMAKRHSFIRKINVNLKHNSLRATISYANQSRLMLRTTWDSLNFIQSLPSPEAKLNQLSHLQMKFKEMSKTRVKMQSRLPSFSSDTEKFIEVSNEMFTQIQRAQELLFGATKENVGALIDTALIEVGRPYTDFEKISPKVSRLAAEIIVRKN